MKIGIIRAGNKGATLATGYPRPRACSFGPSDVAQPAAKRRTG